MSTRAHYHPRGIDIDLAEELPDWLYNELASLRGQIDPPPAPPVLTCIGNGAPMYVYRHESGRYFARHYPGDNPDGHRHAIKGMSDEHRRQAEYTRRGAVDHGWDAQLEKSTGNSTRLDVAVFGTINTGFEIQRSQLSRAKAKSRAEKSFNAGWPTAWITDQIRLPDWVDHVPSARFQTRHAWSESMPPRNTAKIVISHFDRERDNTRPSGWRYNRTPRYVLLDELAHLMPAGEIIPVTIGSASRKFVVLAAKDASDVIDSCTYSGASLWRPDAATPRRKEAAQYISRGCHQGPQLVCDVCGLGISPAFGISTHFDCRSTEGITL